jgi:transcriptional regulator with XRE-family HTH domain
MKRLGERIRRKREYRRMQLNDLASKVGITSSALSQIENGKAFPSIIHLKNIADSLFTTVGEVIGEHETLSKNPLLKVTEKKLVHKNVSGAKSYLLSHHDPQKQMETYSIMFVEGSNANEIMTNHPGQEFCHVIEGSVEFILDENIYILKVGDSFYFNSNVSHSVKNINEGRSEIIWIITPPQS